MFTGDVGRVLSPQVKFDSVGGLSNHIQSLKEMVVFPLLYPEIFEKFKIQPPRLEELTCHNFFHVYRTHHIKTLIHRDMLPLSWQNEFLLV